MAEQSSTVVAFRAVIMLVCLLLIPVAAFCGGSFPAVVKAIQSGRWPTLADFRGPAGPTPSQTTEAPRFVPPATDAKTLGFSGSAPGCYAKFPSEMAGGPVVAVNYNAPITAPPKTETGPSPVFSADRDPGVGPDRRLAPLPAGANNLLPLDRAETISHFDAPATQPGSAGSSSSDNQLKYVLDRLHQLGVTYFVLEPCGDEKREFRFYCQMSVGGNPRVTKPFWCFDGDPLKAMTRVLSQVENWQNGGG